MLVRIEATHNSTFHFIELHVSNLLSVLSSSLIFKMWQRWTVKLLTEMLTRDRLLTSTNEQTLLALVEIFLHQLEQYEIL